MATSKNKFYSIDREAFIIRYKWVIKILTRHKLIKQDLIHGSEFIITADDILTWLECNGNGGIDPELVGETEGTFISAKDCKLIYNHKK